MAGLDVAKAKPFHIATFDELVRHVARLAYLNKDNLLFFRGQHRDYANRAGASSFYPSIYREDNVRREEIALRFRRLDRAAAQLRALFISGKVEGHADLARKRWVQWSVLQHYGVATTPLLDFTQSARVACSFAMHSAASEGYVFVFGLPYISNRISMNSEHDSVVIRLLSICPPSAVRPYFQEGYLAATSDVTADYETKSELDFNRRLIAKFTLDNSNRFWGRGLRGLSSEELYPPVDAMQNLCDQIHVDDLPDLEIPPSTATAALGEFVAAWAGLERLLMQLAQRRQTRILSIPEAIRVLRKEDWLPPWLALEADRIRHLRNRVVHGHEKLSDEELRREVEAIQSIRRELELANRKHPSETDLQ